METKRVAYAYPASDTACRYGFGRTGCYFVHIFRGDRRYSGRRDRGFATLDEAIAYAETLPIAYDRNSLLWIASQQTAYCCRECLEDE